jgi:hypothetical protein
VLYEPILRLYFSAAGVCCAGCRQVQVAARFWVHVAFVGQLLSRQRPTGFVVALLGWGSRANNLKVTA